MIDGLSWVTCLTESRIARRYERVDAERLVDFDNMMAGELSGCQARMPAHGRTLAGPPRSAVIEGYLRMSAFAPALRMY